MTSPADSRKELLEKAAQIARSIAERDSAEPRLHVAAMFLATACKTNVLNLEPRVHPNPLECPNCGEKTDEKRLFCCEVCSQEAGFIRYVRRALQDGRLYDLAVLRDAIGTKLLMIRSGGYPTRERTVPALLRVEILQRDDYRCQLCGKEGNEIDHIAGSANTLENLRVLWKACNGNSMSDNTTIVTDPEIVARIRAIDSRLAQRVAADPPLRLCDDETSWDRAWRTYKKRAVTSTDGIHGK